ncbi:MAG: Phage tail protein [Oscillospiraceae bacterium]|jgi:phage baseplate assembly protein W
MDLELFEGDFITDENGKPKTVTGAEELFQRAKIRLTVPIGSFALNPQLGSRLHTLTADTPLRDEKALSMAQEALRNLPQLTVESAAFQEGNPPKVIITLNYGGECRDVEVQL